MKSKLIVFISAAALALLFAGLIINRPSPPEENIRINGLTGIKIDALTGADKKDKDYIPVRDNISKLKTLDEMRTYLYEIDQTAFMEESDFNLARLLSEDVTADLKGQGPKVLVFHTHSQETYADSREGFPEDSIVGVGAYLAEILSDRYNIGVVHDIGQYDVENGQTVRGRSYERMEVSVRRILEKYPSIEVTLDIHRDGVPEDVRLVKEIDGADAARLMFFNGISKENINGAPCAADSLPNPYINETLALSLKAQLIANELYPGLARRIYIRPYRYSLHLRPRSMLIEVGANTNTVAEARRCIELLAEILVKTLTDGTD